MNRARVTLAIVLSWSLLLTQQKQAVGQRSDLAAAVESVRQVILHEMAERDLPALSIALVDEDSVVWQQGFGFVDPQRTRPATEATVYRVGSVSKLFTDIAVMQLVADGTLDLDDPVAALLPGFAVNGEGADAVTLRQLMSHQSGMVREPPVGNYFDPTEPGLAATVASLNQTSLVYPAGSRVKYSNAAVAVVGAVLEQHCEQSHAAYVKSRLLDPLGMRHSRFDLAGADPDHLATGWMWTYDGRRFEAPTWLLGTGPAGNLYASVSDLGLFIRCLLNHGRLDGQQIISADVLREMSTPVVDANGAAQAFGLGFHVRDRKGVRQIGHGGAVYGFSTEVEVVPEHGIGVAVACALDGSNGLISRIAAHALDCLHAVRSGAELPDYELTVALPPERARELRGTYRAGDRVAEVSELNGRTWLRQGTFRQELRSRSSDGTMLADDVLGGRRSVELTADQELLIGDRKYSRLPDVPPPAAPDDMRELVGEYGTDFNTLYILEDHGRLVALIEWFYYYPLTRAAQDVYDFPDYGLYHGEQLRFQRGDDGRITGVVAAEVNFDRRQVGTTDGETFRIEPVRPIEELRPEALSASPPSEDGDFRASALVDMEQVAPTIALDIRYATTNNFTGAVFYRQPKAFMQQPAADAVAAVHRKLAARDLGLMIHDAYRPWHVTRMFWDATPESMKDFVADPMKGSRHNRGCAVDLTLFDRDSGQPIPMVAGYDEFSERSFPTYPGGTTRQRWYRDLLRREMESAGFRVYEFEWWHFDYKDWRKYKIGNQTFEELLDAAAASR